MKTNKQRFGGNETSGLWGVVKCAYEALLKLRVSLTRELRKPSETNPQVS